MYIYIHVQVSSELRVFAIIAVARRILTGNIIATTYLQCISPIAPSGADANDEQTEKANDEERPR